VAFICRRKRGERTQRKDAIETEVATGILQTLLDPCPLTLHSNCGLNHHARIYTKLDWEPRKLHHCSCTALRLHHWLPVARKCGCVNIIWLMKEEGGGSPAIYTKWNHTTCEVKCQRNTTLSGYKVVLLLLSGINCYAYSFSLTSKG
jgi:hypothetical protein